MVTLVSRLFWRNVLLVATDLVHDHVLNSQPLLRGHVAASQDEVIYPKLYLKKKYYTQKQQYVVVANRLRYNIKPATTKINR